ncbi:MAG: hypothetical protein ABI763_10925 [Bacteroidota bacterium]
MKIYYSFIVLFIFAFFGCKEPKTVNNTPAPPPHPQKITKAGGSVNENATLSTGAEAIADPDTNTLMNASLDPLMRFIVSFYSIGSGIDRGQPDNLKAFVDVFSKKNSKSIEFNEVHWGREGETDYCFTLNGLSDIQVIDFIEGAKGALKAAEHVHFNENQACRKGR